MKVLQTIPGIGGRDGGTRPFMLNIVDQLRRNGVEAEIRSCENVPARTWGCIPACWFSPALGRLFDREVPQYDIVHNNSLWMSANVYPYRTVRRLRRAGLPAPKVVTSPHGTLSRWALHHGRLKKAIVGALVQYPALRETDLFHATSEKEFAEIRAAGYRQPVAVIPIGLPAAEICAQAAQSPKTWGTPGLRKLVFLGRIHAVKGVDRLLRAWARLAALPGALDGWELLVAGTDCGCEGDLRRLVAEEHLPRVTFVGPLFDADKYAFLSAASLYAFPSHTENFGLTVAEALACATPVIASKGTPWSGVEANRCGWWVGNDVETLAETIRTAMASDLQTLGENGRAWIARDFDWDAIGRKFVATYRWLLDPKANPKPEWVRT